MKGRFIEVKAVISTLEPPPHDLIIVDTPEAVILSRLNPERREVARLSLEKLIGVVV